PSEPAGGGIGAGRGPGTDRAGARRVLAEHWRGEIAPARKQPGLLGLALGAAGAALVLAAIYLGYSILLGGQSDPVARELAQLRLSPPPQRPASGATPEISKQLAAEIGKGQVVVTDSAGQSVIVIRSDNLFASGNAPTEPALQPI